MSHFIFHVLPDSIVWVCVCRMHIDTFYISRFTCYHSLLFVFPFQIFLKGTSAYIIGTKFRNVTKKSKVAGEHGCENEVESLFQVT